jgi:hypothetical protein
MNGYIVDWNLLGRRASVDLKTEAGVGQEERAKGLWTSSDSWTRRGNASARPVHPVSASSLILRRIQYVIKKYHSILASSVGRSRFYFLLFFVFCQSQRQVVGSVSTSDRGNWGNIKSRQRGSWRLRLCFL